MVLTVRICGQREAGVLTWSSFLPYQLLQYVWLAMTALYGLGLSANTELLLGSGQGLFQSHYLSLAPLLETILCHRRLDTYLLELKS